MKHNINRQMILILMGLLLFVEISNCQQSNKVDVDKFLIWQVDNNGIASGLGDNYRFFEDGRFEFGFNQMTDFGKRIIGISGEYKLSKDSLIFIVKETTEIVGGNIRRSPRGLLISSGWEIEGGEIKTIPQKDIISESVPLLIIPSNEKSGDCISIDGDKYYRMSLDPNAYK